jgi:hypothetical protein
VTQTTCPLHINSKNSEKGEIATTVTFYNIPFFPKRYLPLRRASQNGKMELIKIFIDFYFYLLRLPACCFCCCLPLASGKEKCEKEKYQSERKEKIANEMKCHLRILFQFLIKIFLGRDMRAWRGMKGMEVLWWGFKN